MPSTNGHGSPRAILYARVSTDEQARTGYSLALTARGSQRLMPAREGYQVLGGGSGSRPEWSEPWRGQEWTVCGTSWPPVGFR